MSTRSFAATANPVTVAKEKSLDQELALREPAAESLAVKDHYQNQVIQNVSLEGEINPNDIRLPRLNLVQKSGKLNNDFAPGTILFNKDIVLTTGKDPVPFTALRLFKQYQNSLPYDPNAPMPKVYNTSEEVLADGGHFCYDERKDGNFYKEMGHVVVLLECPEGATEEQRDLFIYEFQGKDYALAKWTVTGGAWTIVGMGLITAAVNHLKDGLWKGKWTLASEKKVNGELEWFAFVMKAAGLHTPEFVAFAESLRPKNQS